MKHLYPFCSNHDLFEANIEFKSNLVKKLINLNIFNTLFAKSLKILIKICRKYSFKKLGKVIALLFLFYQIISLTINYLEYETVIDMKAKDI